MRLTWLADECRAAGLDVYEIPGWQTRQTREGFTPEGVVCHHTATGPDWQDGHVAALLRDGRSDLSGPLAQIGLERDGTVVLVAAGRCNHNGYGTWGNDSIGIEAYNDGRGEPWPQAQIDAYVRLIAALCRHFGWGPAQVKAHRETDPTRKPDPVGIDMDALRRSVFAATPAPEEPDDLSAKAEAQINRIAAIFGIEDLSEPMPEVSRNAAARLDRIYEALGAGKDGLSRNALARLDRVWALATTVTEGPTSLTDQDLLDIAKAVADEQARRQAA